MQRCPKLSGCDSDISGGGSYVSRKDKPIREGNEKKKERKQTTQGKRKKERKQTSKRGMGEEDRVPTCTSRILEGRSGGQVTQGNE